VNGRTENSGIWESTGEGRYLEGGVDSGAMLVDQRFLPRIVEGEGEVRLNMIGSELVNLVRNILKEGGLSCTLQSGAVYTSYETEDPKFAALVKAFRADLPKVMDSFGMAGEPLFRSCGRRTLSLKPTDDQQGKDIFYIGEFNCSCVGITQDLYLSEVVAKTAIATCAK
jgi:hypothetical protein